MTETTAANPLSLGTDYETLANRFRPIFREISAGTVEREKTRALPHEQIAWLKQAGFGAVRVPTQYGGAGASIGQLFELLIELAEADSNIVQALRAHFAFVEDRLNAPPSDDRDQWFARFVKGDLVGNGWTEVGSVKLGDVITKVTGTGDRLLLNGTKYYSTGSIFADWIDVYAQRADTGADVIAVVDARHPGVRHSDDWDGFGQRTTGSGTSVYDNVPLPAEHVIPFEERFKYQTAFYQLVLLAVLAGIGRAVERDIAREVRDRKRVFSHGNAGSVSEDAQIQQVVGQIAAQVYAAQAATLRSAEPLQRAYVARFGNDAQVEKAANIDAEIETAKAQVIVSQLILSAATDLFNALGASGVSVSKALDRHWRNARTAASHNPLVYKARIVGDWHINGTEPPYVWQIGSGKGKA
ncbi:acyl-CoA dehydrogenase family protein [Pseudomonas sp. B2M1-30]|uniref:acyl-CoA dehydrogenase family protein n=1 Tax=Pseudomonas TaxID=286 RepID=UPI0021CA8306|nr:MULTISPECIES: acyl-CoA dehydrogenase family protein [Pseudomonas]MCU0121643.1 acyl-CoA dehydrogenase family protein [Pseudomonas sp. B2M1-30]MCU7263751.1 acyl-CoA dehydrogenase family protein [Pseudomonas koreensis]